MEFLHSESDGIVFGYTRRQSNTSEGGLSYKSMNYHRHSGYKRGKTIWNSDFPVSQEPIAFDESDFARWMDSAGNLWWTSNGAATKVGANGERVAFFPKCANRPGPWHGYPVSPRDDENYEIPEQLIREWQTKNIIDDLIACRMRKGKI